MPKRFETQATGGGVGCRRRRCCWHLSMYTHIHNTAPVDRYMCGLVVCRFAVTFRVVYLLKRQSSTGCGVYSFTQHSTHAHNFCLYVLYGWCAGGLHSVASVCVFWFLVYMGSMSSERRVERLRQIHSSRHPKWAHELFGTIKQKNIYNKTLPKIHNTFCLSDVMRVCTLKTQTLTGKRTKPY